MSHPTHGHAHWSIGILVGIPTFALVIAAFLIVALLCHRYHWDSYDRGMGKFLTIAFTALAVVTLLLAVAGYYPWTAQYHQWQPITGTVATTNSRFIAAGHGTNQKFVVTYVGAPDQAYGCNDTRCSVVRPGDTLTITCKRTFQWFGTPGYDCNFVALNTGAQS